MFAINIASIVYLYRKTCRSLRQEYDEEIMRELQRLKREEYEEFMRRRQEVYGNPRVKILGKLLVGLLPCWLFVAWVYEEKHRSFEDRIQRDAQMRSAVAWNQSTREVFNQRQGLGNSFVKF